MYRRDRNRLVCRRRYQSTITTLIARIPGIHNILSPVADIQPLTVLDCLSVRPSICLSVCLCLSIRPSVCLFVLCLSFYMQYQKAWFFINRPVVTDCDLKSDLFSWTFNSCYNWVCYQTELFFMVNILNSLLKSYSLLRSLHYDNFVVIEPERFSFYHSVYRHTFKTIIHSPYLYFIVDWNFENYINLYIYLKCTWIFLLNDGMRKITWQRIESNQKPFS